MTAVSPPARPRLEWVDTAKGLLIVLVVLWHVVLKSYLRIDWNLSTPVPGAWGLIAEIAYPLRMPLFFLLSGCFAARALVRPWRAVIRGRVVRFLYLYLLWTLVHMVTMWAFPDFPTLVPRSVASFIEAITISPPNTWYLYALALYFLIAKGLRHLPIWLPLTAALALTTAVGAGLVPVVSNRGSLLANLLYFLIGAYLAPRILPLAARPRLPLALLLVVLYLGAFATVRVTDSSEIPGVWPAVALLGTAMGIFLAPLLAEIPGLGRGLRWLGARTLPIYVIHMPVLAAADALLAPAVSAAGGTTQLIAAAMLPALLTAAVIAVSVVLGSIFARIPGLLDLPRIPAVMQTRPPQPGSPETARATAIAHVGGGTPREHHSPSS